MAGIGKFFHVGALSSGTIKVGSGLLHRVIINKNFQNAHLAIVDSTDPNSTTYIAEDIEIATAREMTFMCQFVNGLSFKFSGTHGCDVTIIYE